MLLLFLSNYLIYSFRPRQLKVEQICDLNLYVGVMAIFHFIVYLVYCSSCYILFQRILFLRKSKFVVMSSLISYFRYCKHFRGYISHSVLFYDRKSFLVTVATWGPAFTNEIRHCVHFINFAVKFKALTILFHLPALCLSANPHSLDSS